VEFTIMKRSIYSKYVLLAAVVAFGWTMPAVSLAQTTDFSGTWNFDPSKSQGKPETVSLAGGEAPEVASDGRIGGGGGNANLGGQPAGGREAKPIDAFRQVIKQSPTEINIVDGGVALVFKLDGTEQNISALNRAGYPKGKAAWEGNKLVLTTRQDVYVGRAQFDTRTIKYIYSLVGGTLTIEKTDTFQGQTKTTKLVYNKAAA
jgi:hypothetical protein